MWSKIGEGMKMVKTKKNTYVGYVEEVGNCPDHGGNYLVLREGSKHHLFFKDDLTMVSHEVKKIKTKKNVYVGYVEEVGNCPDHGGNYLVLREGSKHHLFFEDDVTISNNTSEDVVEYESTEIVSRDEDMEVASKTTPHAQTNTVLSDEEMITREGSRDEDMEVASKTTPNAQTNTVLSDEGIITREGSRDEDMEVASKTTPHAQTNTVLSDEEMITREGSRDEDMEVASKTTPNAQTNTVLSDEGIITREDNTSEDINFAPKKFPDKEMGPTDAQRDIVFPEEDMLTQYDGPVAAVVQTVTSITAEAMIPDEAMHKRYDDLVEQVIRDEQFQEFSLWRDPFPTQTPTLTFDDVYSRGFNDGYSAACKEITGFSSYSGRTSNTYDGWGRGNADGVDVMRRGPRAEGTSYGSYSGRTSNTYDGWGRGNADRVDLMSRGPKAEGTGYGSYSGRTSNTYDGWERGNADGVDVISRGPRLQGTGNQMGTSVVAPRGEQYNKEDFPVDYANAKFFVIKSRGEDDVHKSIKYNFWSSTRRGNKKLGDAYDLAQKMPGGCPIFLLFSVTTSRQFVGLAEMKGPVDFKKNVGYWQQQGNWKGSFPLKWHIVKDVPNSHLRHIIVEIDGERKPVTESRDTEKVMLEQGLEIVRIFKQHRSKTCILHDFPFYERREKGKGPMTFPIVG